MILCFRVFPLNQVISGWVGLALFPCIQITTRQWYKIVTDRSANPERTNQEISICSVRAGSIPGTHEVLFSGKYDSIKLTHRVEKRELLANAAIKVGIWLSSQDKGIYTMNDFIKFD